MLLDAYDASLWRSGHMSSMRMSTITHFGILSGKHPVQSYRARLPTRRGLQDHAGPPSSLPAVRDAGGYSRETQAPGQHGATGAPETIHNRWQTVRSDGISSVGAGFKCLFKLLHRLKWPQHTASFEIIKCLLHHALPGIS